MSVLNGDLGEMGIPGRQPFFAAGRQGVIRSASEGSITVIRKSGYHKEKADSLFGSWLKVGDFYEWQDEI